MHVRWCYYHNTKFNLSVLVTMTHRVAKSALSTNLSVCLQKAIADFSYDWSRLLCSDLGLSESGMRNLLSHRDDIQNSSYLSETEQKHINTLKTKFHL